MHTANDSLKELLACAESPDDFAAIEELIEEAKQAKPVPDRWLLPTLGDVAEFFGFAESTVKQWRTGPNPMPGVHGKWPIKEIVRWRENKLKATDIKAARLQQDFELGEIDLENARIDLAKTKGEIFDRADVERWAGMALVETREMVMTLPETLATSCPPELREVVRSEADKVCRSALAMLRKRLEDTEEIDGTESQPKDED